MQNDYKILADLLTIKELLGLSDSELARKISVSVMTFYRWKLDENQISESNIKNIYEFAYNSKINLNKIKSQLFIENIKDENQIILFHGSKQGISGKLSLDKSKLNNDFGKGFYCGDSLQQAAMFVSLNEKSSLYILKFNLDKHLKYKKFTVNQEWMLTNAYFRNKIVQYENTKIIQQLKNDLKDLDYIVAPIADNRMFAIIDEFVNGIITDVACEHALSATNLGYQYVILSERALENIEILAHCYLATSERKDYLNLKEGENKIGSDKALIAKREYRGQGLYIDQILK